jgi:NAD-dependent dihydropyrimidine dehydrogenase PreA subunit
MMTETTECRQSPGTFMPVVNRSKCEGKEACVAVCPYQVFEIRLLGADDKRALSFVARLKALAHGNRQAFAVRAADCHACGRCVEVCPENAITLTRARE